MVSFYVFLKMIFALVAMMMALFEQCGALPTTTHYRHIPQKGMETSPDYIVVVQELTLYFLDLLFPFFVKCVQNKFCQQ